jgi:2-haloacid dehalogenase
MTRLLAFDWFNTLGNVRDYCTRDELRSYAEQIERNKTDWQPFELPERWAEMPVFDDVVEGIAKLRARGINVVIFSNAPEPLALAMLDHNGVEVDGVMPLEDYEFSKPTPFAYEALAGWAFDMFGVSPRDISVVTANAGFGDIRNALSAGMNSILIRGEDFPTLLDLAEALK